MFPFYEDVITDDVKLLNTDKCHCNKNDFIGLAENHEKRLQRRFIKKHLATNGNNLHTFNKHSLQNRRFRRDYSNHNESQESSDVETVLTDLADQEIVEVDIIMDDIYDEIRDLQVIYYIKMSEC